MIKCIIWGAAKEYQNNKNNIDFEVMKGNMKIIAIVSKDKYASYIDGNKVIDKEDLVSLDYDYIVVFNKEKFTNIKNEAIQLGIDPTRIINGMVFSIPCFDFKRYIKIWTDNVSIISDNCFAALLYNYLGMEFQSPFILQQMLEEDYIKLLCNLDFYLSQELKMERDLNLFRMQAPIGTLGEGDDKVRIYFNHSNSFEQAKSDWDRRKKRIGDNIFVKMSIKNDDYVAKFDSLPYNKIGFSAIKMESPSIIYCPRYLWRVAKDAARFGNNTIDQFTNDMNNFTSMCDVFKMLCGEKDYLREI